jgi:hypothetical protein
MDAAKEREIIRLWNRLRLLEKEGRSVMAVPGSLRGHWPSENAMQLDQIRTEIERMRTQVQRQRGETGSSF